MKFTLEQAKETARKLGIAFDKVKFTVDDLLAGMNVELEHGKVNVDTNITDDDPIITGKIALAHLNESPLYYSPKVGVEAWEESLKKDAKKQAQKTEYKTLPFILDEFDEEEGIFSGYAAVFGNVDSGGDIIEPGAFTKTIAEGWERVKILFQHNGYDLPIGKPLELREDSRGLYIKGKISNTTKGNDVKTLLRDRVLNELSIGYDPIVFDYDNAKGVRHLREVRLWEVSVVTWAMNPEAVITGYKSKEAEKLFEEVKAGRKISKARLQTLAEACKDIEEVVKTIKSIIKECEGKGKSTSRKAMRHKSSRQQEIEIIFD